MGRAWKIPLGRPLADALLFCIVIGANLTRLAGWLLVSSMLRLRKLLGNEDNDIHLQAHQAEGLRENQGLSELRSFQVPSFCGVAPWTLF